VHVATSAVYATTSTVLVAPDGSCLVVDPGVTAHEIAALSSAIHDRGWSPVAVWSTHGHWDHLLDGALFRGLPRWSGGWPVDGETLTAERDADEVLAHALLADPTDSPAPISQPPVPYPRVDGLLAWQGAPTRVLEHSAHAAGSTALVVASAGVLLAGDLLSDVEIPLLDLGAPDPIGDYRAALTAMSTLSLDLVVPGHGHVGALAPRVAADLAYLDALAAGSDPDDPRLADPWSAAVHDSHRAAVGR